MTLLEKQAEIITLFDSLGSWQDRFQYLIELGSEFPDFPDHLRIPATKIMSCTSRTYFLATAPDGIIHIQGWSNGVIPSGLIALIKYIFDGCTLEELRAATIDFPTKTKLLDNLTGQRKAGLLEMIDRLNRL